MVVEGQVMDSMKWQTQPLPCEVADLAYAVFDGADALMLGAATSIGINPVQVSLTTLASQHYDTKCISVRRSHQNNSVGQHPENYSLALLAKHNAACR